MSSDQLVKALSLLHKRSEQGQINIKTVSKLFVNAEDSAALYEQLPEVLCECFGFSYSMILIKYKGKRSFNVAGTYGFNKEDRKDKYKTVQKQFLDQVKDSFKAHMESNFSRDGGSDIKSFIYLPVVYKKKLKGAIVLADSKKRKDLSIFIDTILIIADMLAQELIRKDLEEELKKTNRDMAMILDNLEQGLLICNEEGKVQHGCSLEAKRMFGEDIVGKKLAEVFQYDEKAEDSVDVWLNLVFKDMMKFKNIKPLGPSSYDKLNQRYIELDYQIIRNDDHLIDKLLIIATDRTKERQLKQLADEESGFVKSVLAIIKHWPDFGDFIRDVKHTIKKMNGMLDSVTEEGMQEVSRLLHTVKGNCGIFNLTNFIKFINDLENEIESFLEDDGFADRVKAKEFFVSLTNRLETEFEQVMKRYESITNLFGSADLDGRVISNEQILRMEDMIIRSHHKNSSMYQEYLKNFVLEPLDKCFYQYEQLVKNYSTQLKKEISYHVDTTDILVNRDKYAQLFSSMIHVFKNAIDHGIEPPFDRSSEGKKEVGSIAVSFDSVTEENQKLALIKIKDDGRGLNTEKIVQTALKRQIVNKQQLEQLSDEQIHQFVFLPKFTTKIAATELSGRGVGLDAVRYESKKLGGKTWIESFPGEGSCTYIKVPLIV